MFLDLYHQKKFKLLDSKVNRFVLDHSNIVAELLSHKVKVR